MFDSHFQEHRANGHHLRIKLTPTPSIGIGASVHRSVVEEWPMASSIPPADQASSSVSVL
jgi:hypothetical protein